MIEFLFFQTYYSYLKENFEDTKMFFQFLKEEYKIRKDAHALTKKQLRVLKEIKFSIENGKIKPASWVEEDAVLITKNENEPKIKQPELVKKIYFEGTDTLKKLFHADSIALYNIEHPCGKYGAVDMVYKDRDIVYPVEVKIHERKHDLIGQISKYTLYFKLNLHLKMYTEVQPVTICNSYNPHTLKELKVLSVNTLKYDLIEDKIKISWV